MCACKASEYNCKRCCTPWRERVFFFSYECDCTSNRFAVCEALESGVILKPIFSTLLIASCHFNSLKLRFCVIRVFVCAGRSLVV